MRIASAAVRTGLARAGRLTLVVAAVAVPHLHAGEATGALSGPEVALQGAWQSTSGWRLVFKDRTFSATGDNEWYRGSFSAPATEASPAPLDIRIDDCGSGEGPADAAGLGSAAATLDAMAFGSGCSHKGKVSQSAYRWNGKSLLLSGTEPGRPRPSTVDAKTGMFLEMTRVTAAESPGH